jgi:hypothetical protein
MANFNIQLITTTDKGENTSLKSGSYEEVFSVSKIVENTDAGAVLFSGSSDLSAVNSLRSAKGLLIKNNGLVGAEILIKLDTWAAGTPDTNADDGESFISQILGAGDFMFLPNLRQVAYGDTNSASNSEALDEDPSSGVPYKYRDVVANLGANVTTTSGTDITVDYSGYFKVNDLIQLGTTEDAGVDGIEIMKVVGIPDSSSLTVERGLYGSNAGINSSQTTGHVSGAAVYLPFFNMYSDFDKYSTARTDADGRYMAMNLLGYGRESTDEADGFVPGSISGIFYKGGYQELGLSGITAGTETGLTASTEYSFNFNLDNTGNEVIAFTVGTNTKFGGNAGVLQKIQEALDLESDTTGSNMLGLKAKVSIVNGDVRFESLQRHSTSSVGLVKVSSSLFDSAIGRFPIDTALEQAVAAKFPDDVIYDNVTNLAKPNIVEMFYDDGHGNISGACNGTINYETGAITIWGCPPNAGFKIRANYGSAHSGGVNYNATTGNSILEVKGRSLNQKINTTIDVIGIR